MVKVYIRKKQSKTVLWWLFVMVVNSPWQALHATELSYLARATPYEVEVPVISSSVGTAQLRLSVPQTIVIDDVSPYGILIFSKQMQLGVSFKGQYVIEGDVSVPPGWAYFEPLGRLDINYEFSIANPIPLGPRGEYSDEIGEDFLLIECPEEVTCEPETPPFDAYIISSAINYCIDPNCMDPADIIRNPELFDLTVSPLGEYIVDFTTLLTPLFPGASFNGFVNVSGVAEFRFKIYKNAEFTEFMQNAASAFETGAIAAKGWGLGNDIADGLKGDAFALVALAAFLNPENNDIQDLDNLLDWVSYIQIRNLSDAASALLGMMVPIYEAQVDVLRKLADDPPDPDFDQIDTFTPANLDLDIGYSPEVDTALSSVLSLQLDVLDISRGILTTVERYQGALIARDFTAAEAQLEALEEFNKQFRPAAAMAKRTFIEVSEMLIALGEESHTFSSAAFNQALNDAQINGLTPEFQSFLDSRGIIVDTKFISDAEQALDELQALPDIFIADGAEIQDVLGFVSEEVGNFMYIGSVFFDGFE